MSNIFALKVGDRMAPSAVKVIYDGKHYLKHQNIDEIYEAALAAKSNPSEENTEALENLLDPFYRETVLGERIERDNLGNYYLEGTDVPIPEELISTIKELEEQGAPTGPLTKFWKHCLLNPNKNARDDFFQYCRDFGITITDEGYALLYKTVEKNPFGDIPEDLVTFIGTEYLRLKRSGMDPGRYVIVEDEGEYRLVPEGELDLTLSDISLPALLQAADEEEIPLDQPEEEIASSYDELEDVARRSGPPPELWSRLSDALGLPLARVTHGTLQEMYEGVSSTSDAPYGPHHKGGSYGNRIRLGEWVRMPREECDPSREKACSKGLHVGSYQYVDRFSRRDSEILACIVSPRDIVALPQEDHSKIRTCKYYPYAVMRRDTGDGSWEEIDSVHLSEGFVEDEENLQEQLENLSAKDELTGAEENRKEILEERLQEVR